MAKVNIMPPIQAADPAMPVAVPTVRVSNRSAPRVTSAPLSNWCAKPPTQNSAMAMPGDPARPMQAGPIMHSAPVVIVILREVTSEAPLFISQGGSSPAASEPKSAARNGSQAQSAMLLRSSFHTATR